MLDDLTPLHQLADEIEGTSAHLFAPRPIVRLRRYTGFGGSPQPGMVSYGYSGTSLLMVEADPRPDGTVGSKYFNAGSNPPDGVVVHYYLRDKPTGPITLTFLDGEKVIREYSSGSETVPRPPVTPGVNHFVWNLRYSGAVKPVNEDLQVWDRANGPLVVPGTYQVRLTFDGESQTQSFEVLRDPRIATSQKDLVAQRDMILEVRDLLSKNNETLNKIDALLAKVAIWEKLADQENIQKAAAEVAELFGALRPQLIDVNMKQSQLWPSGLHEKLNAMMDALDGSDYAPTRQLRDVFAEHTGQLNLIIAEMESLEKEEVSALNKAIQDAGVPVVGLTS
jgi:hypothetical protein